MASAVAISRTEHSSEQLRAAAKCHDGDQVRRRWDEHPDSARKERRGLPMPFARAYVRAEQVLRI
jgi:hypothetical protein